MPVEALLAAERFNVAADGKRFRCDFIREGPVYFGDHGIEVLRRETLERDLNSFIGKPVTLEHVQTRLNVTDPEVLKVTIGLVDKVGRDAETGWFFTEGEITDDRGREAAKTHSPSCGYRVKGTNAGGRWNNLPYERELSAIEFHHLALSSKRVRYEEAEFRLNAVETTTGESPTMFKFLKKVAAAVTGGAPTVTEIEIPADTVIKSASGKEFRLNDVVAGAEEAATAEAAEKKRVADAEAAAVAAPAGVAAAETAVAAAPAAVASAGIDAATQAAEGRINVTDETEVLVSGKPVKVRALIAAHEERLNAAERLRLEGAADYRRLQDASIRGRTDFSKFDKADGGLAASMKRGKY